jgi:crotonobetainyl-CoA:carnitine CoA-transferase CaiB-like acyl-CoA transferase
MDLIVQASSGLISVTGVEDGELVRCGHSVADVTAGMFAMIGILLALEARNRTGAGQFVDVAMLDSMISAMSSNYAYFLGSDVIPKPWGTSFATIVPYRGFPTQDGEIVIAVASQKLWQEFCLAMGRPELASDPDYASNGLRVKNRAILEPLLEGLFRSETSAYWLERLRGRGIPCTPVRNFAEVVADPQSTARNMFPTVENTRVTGPPVKLSATPGFVPRRAPGLGEHTRDALVELLGLDAAALERLAADRVIPD